ncbi:MAG: glutamate formimidoyltransferase [Rubrobacteraceae bacterium]
MAAQIFEAVPNFSEGRDPEKVSRIVDPVRVVPGVRILDLHSDPDHNRSVLTMAGEKAPLIEAATILARSCAVEINLADHEGVHPRIGALDVLPFVPLEGATLEDAARLAHEAGQRISTLGFAVYLYESAASAPHRRNLAEVRRGGYESLAVRAREPGWSPDYGPEDLDPGLGAVAVGARPFLVAFNAYLDTDNAKIAREVAGKIRERDGGLPGVKALGLSVKGRAQVSMNLTDLEKTSLPEALEAVRAEAAKLGAGVDYTELVGLLPLEALIQTTRYYLGLPELEKSNVLEAGLWGNTDVLR